MKKLLIIYVTVLLSSSILFSQTLIPKVTTQTKSIKQSYLKDIENLRYSLEQYIKSNSFSNNIYKMNIPFTIKLFIDNIDESGNEIKYVCKAIITNEYDQRFFEQGWIFPYNTGTPIMRTGMYNPITSVIDFYGYMIIGTELDAISLMGGNSIYEKARESVEMGKISQWPQGCNTRIKKLEELTENYRLRKARYYYTLAIWDAEDGKLNSAKENLNKAFDFIKQIITLQKKDKYTRIFIEHHYKEADFFIESLQDTFFLPKLREISPEHENYFNEISNNFNK